VREAELALAKQRGEIAQYGTRRASLCRRPKRENGRRATPSCNGFAASSSRRCRRTREFLRVTQERVQLEHPPRPRSDPSCRRLPAVTRAAATKKVLVDPEDVRRPGCGGATVLAVWREAALLSSRRTAEQIYLLLRRSRWCGSLCCAKGDGGAARVLRRTAHGPLRPLSAERAMLEALPTCRRVDPASASLLP
jgi:hypothetical protein